MTWVHEQASIEGASGIGATGALGAELRLGHWLSVDAESYLFYAHPRADVSSWGILAGLTWHVGRVE